MTATPWLLLLDNLEPDWEGFMTYWAIERRKAEAISEAAGRAAFKQQVATGWQLADASEARIAEVRTAERAARKAEAHARSIERRRAYNQRWMAASRAAQRAAPHERQA